MTDALIVNEQQSSNIMVEFYQDAEQSHFLTKEKGYPVFVDKVLCKLIVPGDVPHVVVHEMKGSKGDELKRRYPIQWAAFKENMAAPVVGMPLEEWQAITKSVAETLKAMKFRTVEDVANASDVQIGGIMGGMELRVKAKAFLDSAQDSALAQKQAEDNKLLQNQINALQAQLAALGEEKPKRGRKAHDDVIGDSTTGLQ